MPGLSISSVDTAGISLNQLLRTEGWQPAATEFTHMSSVLYGAKLIRAIEQSMILPLKGRDAKILDYGCGDGLTVNTLRHMGKSAIGYDIRKPNDTEFCYEDFDIIIEQAPYHLISVYDVVDHMNLDEVSQMFLRLKKVLHGSGKIFMRVHPYCSIDGTHSFSPVNLAYMHLCLTPEEMKSQGIKDWAGLKVVSPLDFYDTLISRSGFKTISKKTHNVPAAKFLDARMRKRIKSLHYDGNITDDELDKLLSINLIDYLLTLA